jgi:hypothetical protein
MREQVTAMAPNIAIRTGSIAAETATAPFPGRKAAATAHHNLASGSMGRPNQIDLPRWCLDRLRSADPSAQQLPQVVHTVPADRAKVVTGESGTLVEEVLAVSSWNDVSGI